MLVLTVPGKEQLPNHERLFELAEILGQRFVLRRDLQARQLRDGRYVCLHHPLEERHLVAHLKGKLTLGAYLLDEKSKGRFLVIDADRDEDWRDIRRLSAALAGEGIASYLEPSRRGGHFWFFTSERVPGIQLRQFGQGLLNYHRLEGIEVYPKQAKLTSGPGSLIRLPFGIHKRSGRRYGFYFPSGELIAATISEQIYVLKDAQSLQNDALLHFGSYAEKEAATEAFEPVFHYERMSESAPVSERIKAAMSVEEFVGRYVTLSRQGRGLCPFHDDHVESFSVNREENYWYCFACKMGGSIIDFWMQWRGCDFTSALRELAALLLE
jgi:hypothetical protein